MITVPGGKVDPCESQEIILWRDRSQRLPGQQL